jgi:lipoyl(octanoyl) transferase
MAVDEALLAAAVDDGIATLRLYAWSEPTLSLGYFQRYDDRQQHVASRDCEVVRRQSGGGAILHDRELTYSLTLPPNHSLTRDPVALYTAIHNAFVQLLVRRLAEQQQPYWRLALNRCESPLSKSDEPFLCFQRRACGDLLLMPEPANLSHVATNPAPPTNKIMGSAQRRHRGAILQHGSLLLETSEAAPELPGWSELTGTTVSFGELASGLPPRLSEALPINLSVSKLSNSERELAHAIEQARYASRSWTHRR